MHLLLDECVPKRLASEFSGHYVHTVPQMGWAGIKNGELLSRASREFDVLVTTDRGIQFQQNIAQYGVGVVLLLAPSNDIDDLRPLLPAALRCIVKVRSGEITTVSA